ncbi:MAG: alpha-ketoacid dehydrogenase subunit beta [Firmicutes bacterium]|nr:alpha-ketoacid dehydrogenase subunit beta [Bacillota bacterium]
MAEISVRQAIREAMREEMLRDEKVFLIGESIGPYGGCFKVTEGLWAEFGDEKIMDTPLSESAIVGCGVGAAMMGFKPIVELMFADFVTIGMDQLVNNAAKMKYLHDGDIDFSMVLRMPQGAGATMGPHHSQSVESWIMNIPGIKIVLPSNAYDAKGLLKSAVRDNNPIVFIEHKLLYNDKGEVPTGDYTVPLGKAKVVREGTDVTIIAYSYMVKIALQAAEMLAQEGINAEVVDVRTIRPLDIDTLADSVKKTEKAVIVHEAPVFGGAAGEIAAALQEKVFDYLDAPIGRIGAAETPVPYSQPLEHAYLPNAKTIAAKVREIVTPRWGGK